jgi:hypothetical protein
MTCVCNSFEITSSLKIVQQGYDDLSGSEVDHESSELLRIAFPDSHALLRNQNCSSLLELIPIPQMLPLVAKRASLHVLSSLAIEFFQDSERDKSNYYVRTDKW